jgi:hypothetical protein
MLRERCRDAGDAVMHPLDNVDDAGDAVDGEPVDPAEIGSDDRRVLHHGQAILEHGKIDRTTSRT